jgi:hypothetical protein
MAISKLKKGYLVTLTPANVDRFKGCCRTLGLPPVTMSNLFDDTLKSVSETFEMAINKGSIEISDLFRVMGQQMKLIEEDKTLMGVNQDKLIKKESKNAISRQKRNIVPH